MVAHSPVEYHPLVQSRVHALETVVNLPANQTQLDTLPGLILANLELQFPTC